MLNHRIHGLRTAMGLSQIELARRLKVSKQEVSNWGNDNIQPSIDLLLRLADLFGVTTDYLLGWDDLPRLDVSGLSKQSVAHVSLLIADLRRAGGQE